jgi:hypothetical protein
MPDAYSKPRIFDYVTMEGLRRTAGRPAHEWDIYILKELLDNAIDADEAALTETDLLNTPSIHVEIEYLELKKLKSQQLFIKVRNQAAFPIDKLRDVFDPNWYTSRKAFFKGLTRGAMGNALKTILGIPYALHYRATHNWDPDLKPLRIKSSNREFQPKYIVDSTNSDLTLEIAESTTTFDSGTEFAVGIDEFVQEFPRTIDEIKDIAHMYHICNPHVKFSWRVEISDEEWIEDFDAENLSQTKFLRVAPISWYSPEAFRHLLGAIYREKVDQQDIVELDLGAISPYFSNVSEYILQNASKYLDIRTINHALIESEKVITLYYFLEDKTSRFDSLELGCVGEEYLKQCLPLYWDIDGKITYLLSQDNGVEPQTPFLIEVAAAWLKAGKRQLISAINFTPTYVDPFLSSSLTAPISPDERALGLRGFADLYGIDENTPFLLFVHIICPNVAHSEFSKTQIDHLPFKHILGEALHHIINDARQLREEAELQIERKVKYELQQIVSTLDDMLYVPEQLHAKLRANLAEFPELKEWLSRPDCEIRIRAIIANYHQSSTESTLRPSRPARSITGIVVMPLHPDRYYAITPDHFSNESILQHMLNKIILLQNRDLEPVVLENNWLCLNDMALMRNPSDQGLLKDMVVQLLQITEETALKVIVIRDSDDQGQALVNNINKWAQEEHLDTNRIIDLAHGLTSVRLMEMMPPELFTWINARLTDCGVSRKCLPSLQDIRKNISKGFEEQLLSYLWAGVSHQLAMPRLLSLLDRELNFTNTMIQKKLDEKIIKVMLDEITYRSYSKVLSTIVGNFFEEFLDQNETIVREIAHKHLENQQNE